MIKNPFFVVAGLSLSLGAVRSYGQEISARKFSEPVCSVSFKEKAEGVTHAKDAELTAGINRALREFRTERELGAIEPVRLSSVLGSESYSDSLGLFPQDPKSKPSVPTVTSADHHDDPWQISGRLQFGISLENKRSAGGPLQYPKDAAFGGVAGIDAVATRADSPIYFGAFGATRYYFDNENVVDSGRESDEWMTKFGGRVGGLIAETDCSDSEIFSQQTRTWEVKAFRVDDAVLGMDQRSQVQATTSKDSTLYHTGTEIRSTYGLYYTDLEVSPSLGTDTQGHSWGFLCQLEAQQPLPMISDSLKVGAHGGLMIDEFSTLWSYKWGLNATLEVGSNCGIVVGYDRMDIDGGYGQDEVIYVLFEKRFGRRN